MVGAGLAGVLAGLPGARVTLVDVDERRAAVADALGVAFARADDAPGGQDLVFHASATADGLALALRLLRSEGEVIELSWYGDRPVTVPLGEAFHSGRLTVRASQVGAVAPARRGHRSMADRLTLALDLLHDSRFDALLSGESTFEELPLVLPALASGEWSALCHVITYGKG
jgi:threonine dehydrogenase-like Zn-dependent dehydrogenase